MSLESGFQLGPYRIISLLGSGGMGEVYRAQDPRLGRDVAIKILPENLSRNPEAVRRFEREVRTLATLSHPNILSIFDIGREQEVSFAVTELLIGETLRNRLALRIPNQTEAIQFGIAIGAGLICAHTHNIIHRDLKPENIFITSDGVVKILDFGIAAFRLQGQSISKENTNSSVVAGTIPYMSPEQLRGQSLDARSDIFSFGCVLWEMLTGQNPFRKSNPADTITSILLEQPPPLPRSVSAPVQKIILQCLAKDPDTRIQTSEEIVDALKAILTRISIPGPSKKKRIDSIAILPFENTNHDPELEYLSEGITEALINSLSHLPRLKVMARSTVFHYREKQAGPLEIGRILNVGAVLTGRVVQHGDQLLIAAELLEIEHGWHLWGEQYQRRMNDVFALQTEIAAEISDKLKLKLTGKEKQILSKRYTENPVAYQAYLRGRHFWNRRNEDGFRRAIDYFHQAIESDPLYALAYTGLADCYALLGDFGHTFTPKEAFAKSKAAVLRALEIDPNLAEAHSSLAHLKMHEFQWQEALREFQTAHKLNPGYATAHHWHFMALMMLGKFESSKQEMKIAEEIDPLSFIIQTDIAACHYFIGEYETAIRILRSILDVDPNFASAHRFLAAVYEQKGMFENAIEEFEAARICSGKDPGQVKKAGSELRDALLSGEKGFWKKRLEQNEEYARNYYVSFYNRAQLFASVGDTNRAFELLNQAHKEPSASMIYLKVDPRLASLRSDPRFQELLKRVNLQD